jgi:long-subunit acyl-CoA synthetase (AMP-forming)
VTRFRLRQCWPRFSAVSTPLNEHLGRFEQISGDELTPTMKLKRKPINERYRGEIEELYA